MTLIDQRPPEIESREVPGHWEGDLIIGKNHQSALLVTVERQKRYVQIDRLLKFDALTVRKTLQRRFRKLAPELCKSITFDQGKVGNEVSTIANINFWKRQPASRCIFAILIRPGKKAPARTLTF